MRCGILIKLGVVSTFAGLLRRVGVGFIGAQSAGFLGPTLLLKAAPDTLTAPARNAAAGVNSQEPTEHGR